MESNQMSERMSDERLAEINQNHDGGNCGAIACFETCELLAALKAERQGVRELELTAERLELTLASREAAREQYLEEKLAAEAKLEAVRGLQRYAYSPTYECHDPDDECGAWIRADDLEAVLNRK